MSKVDNSRNISDCGLEKLVMLIIYIVRNFMF